MTRKRLVAAMVIAGVQALGACAGEPAGSVGSASDNGPAFTMAEDLRIDGYAHDLVPIDTSFRVAVADDGMIAIGQMQDNNVRFFSPSGELMGSLGRQGEGPAEFMQLWRMGWMADTLYVYDRGLRRFTLINPDLEYVRYIHVPAEAHPGPDRAGQLPVFNAVYAASLYADGSMYGQLGSARDPVQTDIYEPDMSTYARVAEDGTILNYFQWTEGSAENIELTYEGVAGFISPYILPSPERPIMRLDDTGRRMAYVRVAMEGPNVGTFEVEMEDIFSGVLYKRRYPFDPTPITQEMRDSLVEVRMEGAPPEFLEAMRRDGYVPPMFPPIVGLVGGKDDTLWIRMADTDEGRPYRILDPMGEPIGTLLVPSNETIAVADFSAKLVWVIQKDELDVESVVRYSIQEG